MHYARKRRLRGGPCSVSGCKTPASAGRGLCPNHYARWRYHGDPAINKRPRDRKCSIVGCERKHSSLGYCLMHRNRLRRQGNPETVLKVFAGLGFHVNKHGYKVLTGSVHPNAQPNGFILEHRLVMATALGRPLRDEENVHHKNGDRLDNRLENLEIWSSSQPSGQRVQDKITWAKELLMLYEPESLVR